MYHKPKARVMCDPWWVYESMRQRMLSFHLISWAISDCFLATCEEAAQEIQGLCALRAISLATAMSDMSTLLTEAERRRKDIYEALWQQRAAGSLSHVAIFNLNDNPEAGFVTWSFASGRMPGLRTNSGKLWVMNLGRWLSC